MTISTETIKNQYDGNDSTTEFTYEFRIFDEEDLTVIVTDANEVDTTLVLDTDYTVSGVGNDSGTVTYPIAGDPLATGETITIYSDIDYLQETDLEDASAPFQETHESAFDYMTRLIQQLKEAVDRAYKVSVTSDTTPDDLLDDINTAVAAAVAAKVAAEAAQSGAEDAQDAAEAAQAAIEAIDFDAVNLVYKDNANEYEKTQNFNMSTLTDAATIAWDLESNQVAKVVLGGNRAMGTPTNLVAGATYILIVQQDATGSRTLDLSDSTFKFPYGIEPTLSTGANDVDIFSFVSDGSYLYGAAQLDFS